MDATARMAGIAELDLDLETTLAIMRVDGYSQDEITAALDNMPRAVLDSWCSTLRLIAIPKKGKTF